MVDFAAFDCDCGRRHATELQFLAIGEGASARLPEAMAALGVRKPFVVLDVNTKTAAWARVAPHLDAYSMYSFPEARLEPDERAVGSLAMAFDPSCDGVLGVGSGVINDCCKVLARAVRKPQIIIGTAPSMDGYASNSSSMIVGGVKTTLYNACPGAILLDTDILRDAPARMLQAGLGDMLAKSIAICEWRISNLVTGEYYCEEVARRMRASLRRVMENADRLTAREPDAVAAVAEGLTLSGVAMSFARVSRPASGLEHYFSHMWEMMALERGQQSDLHGIQVGVGTVLTLRLYERIRHIKPDRARALRFMRNFDAVKWEAEVRRVFGAASEPILKAAARDGKNDPARHAARLERILSHWDDILAIIEEELPPAAEVEGVLRRAGAPTEPAELGISPQDVRDALLYAREIRDKYLSCSMLWDLGVLYDFV